MLRHEHPSEQAHRRPIQVARRETRPIHQAQKTAVRLPPLERQTVEQELGERGVEQGGVVGGGGVRLVVDVCNKRSCRQAVLMVCKDRHNEYAKAGWVVGDRLTMLW